MNNLNLVEKMPKMLSGKALYDRLTDIPEYDETIRENDWTPDYADL